MKLNNISTGILIVCILGGIVTAATTISDTSISVDNLILSGQTIVAYTAALNTKLSGIETLADVTDSTNVNTAGAVMESDIADQSFTNLFKNYDFESWSNGAALPPDGWSLGGTGASIARNNTEKRKGSYGVELTYGSATARLECNIFDNYYKNKYVTLQIPVKASTPNQARLMLQDGTANVYSSYHTGGGDWEVLKIVRLIDASATILRVVLRVENAGTAHFDNVILVEGLVCPASSPKPLVDDGIMLQSHTPSSASDYGVNGQWCYDDDYIYVCNATDTWIRTSLTTW